MKKIKLSKNRFSGKPEKYALVDDIDYPLLSNYRWHGHRGCSTDYASTMVKGIHIQMHRFILNPSRKMQVDHINGNGLDNRRENLRIVTPSENQLNVRNRYGYRSAA